MSNDDGFKKSAYLGVAYLVDTASSRVIATGKGRFDTVALKLETEFSDGSMDEYKNTMVVMETSDGYFTPTVKFTHNSMLMGVSRHNHNMESCLHWPLEKGATYFLNQFNTLSIQMKSKHEPVSWTYRETKDKSEASEELVIKSTRKQLDAATYKNYAVEVNSGFGTSHSHDRVDDESIVRRRMRFKFTYNDGDIFDINSLFKTLRAFKMYWIECHDLVDCEFTHIKLGEDISLMTSDNKLLVDRKNVEGYQSAISISTPLELEYLVKLMHFYFNLDAKKALGSSSKVGLAMSRVIGRRFSQKHKTLDYAVLDLVFALQNFSESVAQKEISKQNKADKSQILDGIKKVQTAIESIEQDIPESVRDFYKKDKDVIYSAITRPTFAQSLMITGQKLGVDLTEYQDVIAAVEKARQQVVHGERYDAQFLVDLLTQGTTTVEKSEDGRTVSMAFGIRIGALDRLYDLMRILIRKYLETYEA